jgi:FkbM family methyltransferase
MMGNGDRRSRALAVPSVGLRICPKMKHRFGVSHMGLWRHIRTNAEDAAAFGPQFLFRHLSRISGASLAKVRVPGIGEVHIRTGESDVWSIRQIFGTHVFDLGRIPAANARLSARYRTILEKSRTPVIVDAGANIGAASLWFDKVFPEAGIVALEPEPGNFRILKRNVAGHSRIMPLAVAIGGAPGFVKVKNEAKGWSARTSRADSGVPILTMVDAFAKFEGGEPFIAKIDIEGFESDLFGGNVDWLDDVYMVIIEPHDYEQPGKRTSRSFQAAIAARDFEIFISGDSLIYLHV